MLVMLLTITTIVMIMLLLMMITLVYRSSESRVYKSLPDCTRHFHQSRSLYPNHRSLKQYFFNRVVDFHNSASFFHPKGHTPLGTRAGIRLKIVCEFARLLSASGPVPGGCAWEWGAVAKDRQPFEPECFLELHSLPRDAYKRGRGRGLL